MPDMFCLVQGVLGVKWKNSMQGRNDAGFL